MVGAPLLRQRRERARLELLLFHSGVVFSQRRWQDEEQRRFGGLETDFSIAFLPLSPPSTERKPGRV